MAKKNEKKRGLMGYLILGEIAFTGWLIYKSATAEPQPWRMKR